MKSCLRWQAYPGFALWVLGLVLALPALAQHPRHLPSPPPPPPPRENPDWSHKFTDLGLIGTLAVLDDWDQSWEFHNIGRADSAFLPASTFKIFNSLLALQVHAVANREEVIHWDGTNPTRPDCNKDLDMWGAFRGSCVWFYQEMARRIGRKRMEHWLRRVHYGNARTGQAIDDFWLRGDVRISARQQVQFIRRLMRRELPFRSEVQDQVVALMQEEDGKDWSLHAKTGWCDQGNRQIGWFVGFLVSGHHRKVFAINIEIRQDSDAAYRRQIIREIFKEAGLMPGAE